MVHSGVVLGVWKAKCRSCGRCVCLVPPLLHQSKPKGVLLKTVLRTPECEVLETQLVRTSRTPRDAEEKPSIEVGPCFYPCRVKGFTAFTPLRFYYETTPLKRDLLEKEVGNSDIPWRLYASSTCRLSCANTTIMHPPRT